MLRNGRIIPGGWPRMAHEIGCKVSRDELFTNLAAVAAPLSLSIISTKSMIP